MSYGECLAMEMNPALALKLFPPIVDGVETLRIVTMVLEAPILHGESEYWCQTVVANQIPDKQPIVVMQVPHATIPLAVKFHENLLNLINAGRMFGRYDMQPRINEYTEALTNSQQTVQALALQVEKLEELNDGLETKLSPPPIDKPVKAVKKAGLGRKSNK
jgi:hypothetical protein